MLEKLSIWYLRKKSKSVLIGYQLEGGKAKQINDKAYVYDNRFIDIDYRGPNNEQFIVPSGKFHIKD